MQMSEQSVNVSKHWVIAKEKGFTQLTVIGAKEVQVEAPHPAKVLLLGITAEFPESRCQDGQSC